MKPALNDSETTGYPPDRDSGVQAAAQQRQKDQRLLAMTLALVAGITVLRLLVLSGGALSLHFDEAQYWSWSRDLAFGYFSKPPMVAWAIRAVTELCGSGEACIRATSPLFHGATALILFALGRRLYGSVAGFWAALLYLTLPGISFSSFLITSDVPLLFFWAAALYCLTRLFDDRAWFWSVVLGLTIGLGLLSKYAMIFFPLCLLLYCAVTPERRWLLHSGRGLAALLIAVALLLPNLWWNMDNGWITFQHTADNARLDRALFHPAKAASFFFSQFGVFGPLLFACLLWRGGLALRRRASEPERFLLLFSLPVVAIILVQALLSRAHANWAAAAYLAATLLVAAQLTGGAWRRWLWPSFGLHLAAALTLAAAMLFPALLGEQRVTARLMGWQALAEAILDEAAQRAEGRIITDERALMAQLLYRLRGRDTELVMWNQNGLIDNHYELTRQYSDAGQAPLLFVTRRKWLGDLRRTFCQREEIGQLHRADGDGGTKDYRLFVLRACADGSKE